MNEISNLADKVIVEYIPEKSDIMHLIDSPLDELCSMADHIRKQMLPGKFDICSIINAKSGVCSEDCRFCAQSAKYKTDTEYYELLDNETITGQAVAAEKKGIKRFSIVTSGRKLTDAEIDRICVIAGEIKQKTELGICVSIGLTSSKQYRLLKDAGVSRIHNNLEASKNYFPQICTTHTYDEKLESIEAAKAAGFEICCGGIIGLGETFEDRIDLALDVRKIGAVSMPVNILNPIPGTPFEKNRILSQDEILRTIALIRFINPECDIRLAGGRKLMPDNGRKCLESGANAVITGDMLTTAGISVDEDVKMIQELM